jgi:hypothetical protein
MYRDAWQGQRVNEVQALSWPRAYAYRDGFLVSSSTVPPEVKIASAELALRALSETLLPDVDGTTSPIESASVGELSVTYDTAQSALGRKSFSTVEHILAPLLEVGIGSFKQVEVMRA